MTYICLECGTEFHEHEVKLIVEKHGLSEPPYEEYYVCPVCGSTDYEELQLCNECGEPIFGDDVFYLGDPPVAVCVNCYEEYVDLGGDYFD